MPDIYFIKDHSVEIRLFLGRIVAAIIVIFILTTGLIIRLIYLQIVGNEHYSSLAKDNSIKIVPLVPARGMQNLL
jgi:penicillin-binding protein 2